MRLFVFSGVKATFRISRLLTFLTLFTFASFRLILLPLALQLLDEVVVKVFEVAPFVAIFRANRTSCK